MINRRLFIVFSLILLLFVITIAFVIVFSNKKKKSSSLSNTNFQDNEYDNGLYSIRQLYGDTFLFNNLPVVPTGRGQKIAIVADYLSVWYVEDIISALQFNGIHNKSARDILSQISIVNATVIQDEPFNYLEYENLHVPLSNGLNSQVRFNDVRYGSQELSIALQTIFSLLPDVQVIIYYIGASPECPPDNHGLPIDDNPLRSVIQYLMTALSHTRESYNILCLTILFDLPDQTENFYTCLSQLTSDVISPTTVVTTVGTALDSNRSYPSGFPNIINAGGVAWTSNQQPIAFLNSHGGYFTSSPYSYQNSTIPYYQVGTVPNDQDSFIHADYYMGCPDVSGNIRNLAAFFDNYPNPVHYETMSISPVAHACLFAMMNQGTNNSKWKYHEILYRYPDLLFKPVTIGQNDRYEAQNYRSWNPCTGLGIVNGFNLAKILSAKYLLTGNPIQMSSVTITEKMSYLNFFPYSPLQDPLNFQPQHDYYNSLPSFGPQSIWSHLLFFKIDLTTGMLDTRTRQVISHGDTIAILYHTRHFDEYESADVYYILECFDENTVRTHILYSFEFGSPIDPNYRWVVTQEFGVDRSPILLFDRCRFLPVNYQAMGLCLSSRYFRANDSIFATSPSLQTLDSLNQDMSDIFVICSHPYPYIDLIDDNVPENSYFVNLTNYNEFWSCGLESTDIPNIIRSRKSTSKPDTLPFVRYDPIFDPIPQWLLIPLSVAENNSISLRFGNYAIFNTRLRSFVYFDLNNQNRCLQMININNETSAVYKDVLSYCTFRFSPIDIYRYHPKLFMQRAPMNEIDSNTRLNDFLCPLQIYFESPYYKDNQSNARSYTLYVSDVDFIQDNLNYVKLDQDCPNTSRPTSFLFHIDPGHLVSQHSNIVIYVPDTNINRNNSTSRFIDNAISSDVSNSYVRMIPMADTSWSNNMLWRTVLQNAQTVRDTENPHEFSFPVLDNNNRTSITLENSVFASQYLIHTDGGWKPRLGFARNENDQGLNWFVIPNYLNQKPSETIDVLRLTGNYFYHHTFYFLSSTSGTITCSLNIQHQPGLLTEITRENIDTVYYSSQFIIV